MNEEKLADCLGDIRDAYIREAAPGNRPAGIRWRALAGAAAAVLVLAAAVSVGAFRLQPAPESAEAADELLNGMTDGPGAEEGPCDAPGYIRWQGRDYVNHGQAVYEMPGGLELLGEVNRVVREGGILPEDAADLSANFGDGGAVYWFPGNDSLIVFRYKEWDPEVELGRPEPILLMFREFGEEGPHQPGQPYYTLSALMEDSDLIVEGTVPRLDGANLAGAEEAVYTLQVSNVLQGGVETETVQVRVPADCGVFEASRDDRYLLFLRVEADGTFRPVSMSQGVYAIEGEFLHIPANDPCRIFGLPTLHTSDNDFWYGVSSVREEIQRLQGIEPVS